MPISAHGHTNIEAAVPSPCHLPNVSLRVLTDRGLSRVHRQLLLLIDGQRSLAELMRLTGKSANEVDLLLRELAQADLIRLT